MTWADLIAAVRAQIDVSDDQAYAWLLDRARVLNAESDWNLREVSLTGVTELLELPADLIKIEAIVVAGQPFRRATLAQMDLARASHSRRRIYSDDPEPGDSAGQVRVSLWPPVQTTTVLLLRYVADVPDLRSGSPPFPVDIQGVLADAAIAVGLARMDERFDSAGYFDAKFADGIQRLKRRRHGRVGRGGTPIRLVT